MTDNQSPELFGQTPWQTVGPFFHPALTWHGGADLTGGSGLGARADLFAPEHDALARPRPRAPVPGRPIALSGRVLDGAGQPVPDAMIETWQADAAGLFPPAGGSAFPGFGRCATDEWGVWRILTVMPGAVAGPGGPHAPHIAIGVFGRGLLKRLVTRAYFDGDPRNDRDPVLARISPARRPTLMARATQEGWVFDIVLQGAGETVFLDV
jgi:protocatechuate 3,4-dioxygenase alpha subunit